MKSLAKNWPLLLMYPPMLIGFLLALFVNPKDSAQLDPGLVSEIELVDNSAVYPTYPLDDRPPVPGSRPLPAPELPPLRRDSSSAKTVHLGANIYAVTNQTNSFEALINQAAKIRGAAVIDRHFNSYKGKGSGHLMLCNQLGYQLASALNAEYKKIYDEQGWYYDQPNLIVTNRANSLAVLRLATRKKIPAVIGEFGFVDDRVNGDKIGDFMRSREGQLRIAQATIDAARKMKSIENIVLCAGHHGNRGTGGANYKGFHETEYAFATFEAIREILNGDETAAASVKEMDEYDGYFFGEAILIEDSDNGSKIDFVIDSDKKASGWEPIPYTGVTSSLTGFIGPGAKATETGSQTKDSTSKSKQGSSRSRKPGGS